ncbi:DEAD/DEAH box helicase [Candidatus Peregrinibacteria bacterium]|nr:DEAD/DEAH box helicase [Candidatus Peregrinibacteria bacterium]MBT4632257.1 DEAD/DEAH box helicase [Candidatus Peregrinibacteria bacterium]MBT5516653.1 DEAD/DEAH box helicase [Candidatus Peregrinibacteria bacterium]MBT5824332.1 DEAD/DEAH box helicase [Candidatus Peregrinibacteria bacterium]
MNDNSHDSFYGLGIAPGLLKRLDALKFVTPTPIQYKAIPIGISGDDMIGIAQTGTGKTLAFSIPMLQRISALKCQGLVICPTRELALQVDETLQKVGGPVGLKTVVIIGGTNIGPQIKKLKAKPNVIIATPGRLIDHLQQRTFSLKNIGILVLDEADRMLDMGFEPQIKKIMADLPSKRQTMLFSATMPAKISQIARKYMAKPLRVEVAPAGSTTEQVEQELFIVPKPQKMALLNQLLSEYKGTVLVFSRTKHGAKKICRVVNKIGHSAAEIHSNRSLNQRKAALEGFKSGRFRVLVATDIAARGIDVSEIELVINFDLPDNSEDYVHRIGRTGRASHSGKAISFACPEQRKDVKAIERLIKLQLPVLPLPDLPKTPTISAKSLKRGKPRSKAETLRQRREYKRRGRR